MKTIISLREVKEISLDRTKDELELKILYYNDEKSFRVAKNVKAMNVNDFVNEKLKYEKAYNDVKSGLYDNKRYVEIEL